MAHEQAPPNTGRRTQRNSSKWHKGKPCRCSLNTTVIDAGRDYSAQYTVSEQSRCNAHFNPTCAAYKQGSSRLWAQRLATNLLIAQRQRQILPFFPPSLTLPPSHPPWKGLCRASKPAAVKPSRMPSLDYCLPFKTAAWLTERASRARGPRQGNGGGGEEKKRGRKEAEGEFQEKGAGEWCAELPLPILFLLPLLVHLWLLLTGFV